ncbi:FG-GAP-like repeat-containing protein [Ichthyenterobacterium magnum]|uniref:Putative secreted protein (Por secretion system target) n=1 Tax=Ichthyenterobacterium magnum TaxID=1230530 RepID=A0A420DWY8_9FLAO|nr:FG-GAP-like repeat-containing protein [Ichthyenterobacterium magnum]RKE98752.1 putative secreted protein (Por secretion system target) [Ichthyenterobacterium magnum]
MKSKLLFSLLVSFIFSFQAIAQPANDLFGGAIPITPSPEGNSCATIFNLPFSSDGTTDSGIQGSCTSSGLDQFFTWTATTNGLSFSSQNPGNPGIVVWDSTGAIEYSCLNTFSTGLLDGWNVGDDLVIQIYDYQGTSLVDVSFCLEAVDFIPPPAQPVTFTSSSSGSSGNYKLAAVDMNGDFLDDLVSVSSTNVNIREQVNGGFVTKNITTPSADWLPSWSMAAGDYDRNGYTDLMYGNGDGVTFMRSNNSGTGFTEFSTDYNVLDIFSQRTNFVDINDDGHLDAFVCHDVSANVYFINDGSGNLTQIQGGLGDITGNYGSIWIDYDNDRDLDMFIAKCGSGPINQLHTNDGNENYTENSADYGLNDNIQTWSSAWGDFDNDGDMDLFIGASSGSHKLLRNNIDPYVNNPPNAVSFTNVSGASGVNLLTATSTETTTYDFDNDGNLDLVSGGNVLFGNGDLTFSVYEDVFPGAGAYGDLNNDGYIDSFSNGNIYLNNAETNNNWVKIHLTGVQSNINGIGARVEVHTDSGTQIRDVKSGDGFRYMSSLNVHFGIGSDTSINSIVVYWPHDGNVDTILGPPINTAVEITEGDTLTNLENSLDDSLVIYPNPVKEALNINLTDSLENAVYSIFNIEGKLVVNASLNTNTIDVSQLSAGNYILRVKSNNSIKTQKFIKQ